MGKDIVDIVDIIEQLDNDIIIPENTDGVIVAERGGKIPGIHISEYSHSTKKNNKK